jgi:F0F1-type ATP synthase epsilon subunit
MIRTPRELVFEADVVALRVPTHTGQVGLRPRCEATVLAVEPGLVIVRADGGVRYAGTAGGLLACDGATAALLTPLAAVGDDLGKVSSDLQKALAEPTEEMEVRRTLGRLETRIVQELRGEESSEWMARGRIT